jgi:hypothetical protein
MHPPSRLVIFQQVGREGLTYCFVAMPLISTPVPLWIM